MEQRIVISGNLQSDLAMAIAECEHDRIFVLADETTAVACWPAVENALCLRGAELITIAAGDENKGLESVCHVWDQLQSKGATRHSLLINLGGGMVTDLGGFAASTFKRGINFINIPTTLLAMVDASVGGKTGINYGGLKNEIGTFCDANIVIISTRWLKTLDRGNLLSGYAEMLKHALISDEKMWYEHVSIDFNDHHLYKKLQPMIGESIRVKERIVEEDPHERGLRKALNLGHTVGHAFESFAMLKGAPVLHGYAVAWGLACELWLSAVKCGFPTDRLRQTVSFIKEHYGSLAINCRHYDELLSLMRHDKKNTSGSINFTLLGGIGDVHINQIISDEDIKSSLDFFQDNFL